MNLQNSPFTAMKAVYVFLAALIGLLVVALGLYGVVSGLLAILLTEATFSTYFLVKPMAQIIIGLFIMLPHWSIGHHFHLLEGKKK